jgi:hypothetical protein
MTDRSASQIKDAEECWRKWGWRKLDGVRSDGNAAAQLGKESHAQAEAYYKHGTPLDLTRPSGEIIFTGFQHAPPVGTPGLEIEGQFYLMAWGHRFYGLKDLALPPGPDGIPTVYDWKTTKEFKWAKTAEELPDDAQAAIYAAESMVRYRTDTARLVWIYCRTTKPYKSKPVTAIVTRERIGPTLLRIRGVADQMADYESRGLKALDLPYNANACARYGGCPHIERCNLSPVEILQSKMSQDTEADKVAFLQKVNDKMAAQGGAGVAGPPMQLSPDGKHYLDPATNTWLPVVAPPAVVAPPPPPPPVQAAPPPPPPAPPAPATNVPPGATLSPDGAYFMAPGSTEWVQVQIQPPAPPAPAPMPTMVAPPPPPGAEVKRPRGRPRKNPLPGQPQAQGTEPDDDLADAYDAVARACTALAEALRA